MQWHPLDPPHGNLHVSCQVYPFIVPDTLQEFSVVNQNDPNCVVLGDAANQFSYQNLNKAFETFMKMETPVLFAMGKEQFRNLSLQLPQQ